MVSSSFSKKRFLKLLIIGLLIFFGLVVGWSGYVYFTQDVSGLHVVWRLKHFSEYYKNTKVQYNHEYNLYNNTDLLTGFDWRNISSRGETLIQLQNNYGEVVMSDGHSTSRKGIRIAMDKAFGIRYEEGASITGFILRLKDSTNENYGLLVKLYHFHPLKSKPTLRYLVLGGLQMGYGENDKNYFMKSLYVDIMKKRDVSRNQYGENCLQFINGNGGRFGGSTSVPTNVIVDNCRVFIYKPSRDTEYDYESSQTYLELVPISSNTIGTREISLQMM